jgi:hypothetical protein
MDQGSEKTIERKLREACTARGGVCIKLLTDQYIGLPDRMCLFPNRKVVFAEIKSTGKKPRKIQQVVHDRLRGLGFDVRVIDRLEQIKNLIDDVERE